MRLTCVEPLTASSVKGEVQSLAARIQSEDSFPPPFTIRPDGLAVSAQYRNAVERLVDNPRINREGKRELYLDMDAPQANIASRNAENSARH
jgi:hypothetical protein